MKMSVRERLVIRLLLVMLDFVGRGCEGLYTATLKSQIEDIFKGAENES